MKGKCKPKDAGAYVVSGKCSSVALSIYSDQQWEFEETEDGRIFLTYKFVAMFLPRLQFEKDWEIIKTDGKEAAEA